jgi:hypothetical protein
LKKVGVDVPALIKTVLLRDLMSLQNQLDHSQFNLVQLMKETNPKTNVIETSEMLIKVANEYNERQKYNQIEDPNFKVEDHHPKLARLLDEKTSLEKYLN